MFPCTQAVFTCCLQPLLLVAAKIDTELQLTGIHLLTSFRKLKGWVWFFLLKANKPIIKSKQGRTALKQLMKCLLAQRPKFSPVTPNKTSLLENLKRECQQCMVRKNGPCLTPLLCAHYRLGLETPLSLILKI